MESSIAVLLHFEFYRLVIKSVHSAEGNMVQSKNSRLLPKNIFVLLFLLLAGFAWKAFSLSLFVSNDTNCVVSGISIITLT
jgi:hypothetical protein